METPQTKSQNPFINLVCNTFGHNYVVTRKITNHINEYECTNCKKEVTDNISGSLEVLTKKTKMVNNCVSSFFQKKTQRTVA